jgi:His/Glu/Gln/Arg/opine family amino acid ABC transporter permease subunit
MAVLLAVLLSVYGGMLGPLPTPNGFFELISQAEAEGASASNANLFAGISALLIAFAWWVTLTALIKWTPGKARTTALLGIATSWIIFVAVRGLGHFVLVEAEWEVVWANRVLVIVGQWMTEQMTQSPGSPQCIDLSNCYGNNQNWRLWWILYPTFAVIAAAYGTTGDKPARFLVPFTFVSLLMVLIAWTPIEVNYHREVPVSKLALAMLVAYVTYGVSYYYCLVSEDYKANRLRSYIAVAAVATFFFAIFIMDPPEIAKKAAGWLSDNGLGMFGKVSEQGVQASQWGGLFVNLIVATAGCVLGFGVGVVLAFGRQSDLPFFSVPSVAIIELVRSGPLICWLWFAVFLMPDLIDPFYDAEDIMRMLLIFGLFGGCYIAEVLRGGLQAVDSGQKEAAAALGLTPFQTKMQVELPNAVRTTLPSIVSVFIGLWKDTTLLFIINILDFFKLAKDLPNTDIRFLGDFLEPIYVTAVVFWAFAFYLSRVSMRIEKNLGLVKEGGGEIA